MFTCALPTSSNNVYSLRARAGMPILGQQKGSGAQPPDMIPSCSLCWRAVKGSDARRELAAWSMTSPSLIAQQQAAAMPGPPTR